MTGGTTMRAAHQAPRPAPSRRQLVTVALSMVALGLGALLPWAVVSGRSRSGFALANLLLSTPEVVTPAPARLGLVWYLLPAGATLVMAAAAWCSRRTLAIVQAGAGLVGLVVLVPFLGVVELGRSPGIGAWVCMVAEALLVCGAFIGGGGGAGVGDV